MRICLLATLGAVALLSSGVAAQGAPRPSATPAARPALLLKYTSRPTSASITAGDLMSRLYVFADDSMQGREAGTPGAMKGTAYIAREAKRLGLIPAGDNGTYFQNVPFISRTLSRQTTLYVANGMYNAFADFVALPFRGAFPRAVDSAVAIYGGAFGDTINTITAAQAKGRFVVFTTQNGVVGRIPPNSPLAQAAAFAFVGDERMTADQQALGRTPSLTLKPDSSAPTVPVSFIVTPFMAEKMIDAPLATAAVGTLGKTITGNLMYAEKAAPTRNVIAVLPGSDPALRGQYVALGAHSDHIGLRAGGPVNHDSLHAFNTQRYFLTDNPTGAPLTPSQRTLRDERIAALHVDVAAMNRTHRARRDSINNGADDDGSGTVTVLEVAEAFAKGKIKPKRSLLFVWHTGEEKGLLGSRYYTDHPTVPRDSIVAQINLDMVGRGAATDLPSGGDRFLMLVGSRRLSTELGDLAEAVNREDRAPFTFDYSYDANGHPENVYCRSDHYNYARYGIPVVFFTTGLHGDYHQVTDEPQYIDYPHMAHIGRLVFALTNRIAGLDHRLVVDKPKPDPAGTCKQ